MKLWERLLLFSLMFSMYGKCGQSETTLANISAVLSMCMGLLFAFGAVIAALRSSEKETTK